MRLSDLRDKKVRTLDGETIGRVHEVHCDKGRVTALVCGAAGFFERLTARKEGRPISWECVQRVGAKEIVVTPDAPQKVSASRSRQGTRRPTARRSKR